MIKCIAIDDEPKALEVIKSLVSRVDFISLEETFLDPFKAISYLDEYEIDFIFLDINMPDLSGLDLLKNLKRKPLVVFTTAYSEYAMDSYELNAVDYLLKPFDFARLFLALTKVKERLSELQPKKSDFFFLNTGSEKQRLSFNEIYYIEGEGNYVRYHTEKGKFLARVSIKETLKLLAPVEFVQIHRSFIISLKSIEKIEDNHVYIKNRSIPISGSYKDHFYSLIDLLN
jgi:two-component system, LytTR family, response regulator